MIQNVNICTLFVVLFVLHQVGLGRYADISPDVFFLEYIAPRRPVVIEGSLSESEGWLAGKWSNDYLREKVRSKHLHQVLCVDFPCSLRFPAIAPRRVPFWLAVGGWRSLLTF